MLYKNFPVQMYNYVFLDMNEKSNIYINFQQVVNK